MSYNNSERTGPAKIDFTREAVENVNRSLEEDRVVFDDVDFVTLYQAGSSNTTIHRVDEWWDKLHQQARNGAIPSEWVDKYKEAYERWVGGKDPIVQGTHLSEWPRISRSQAEMLNAAHVRTVEELANANEQTMDAVGMGARKLRDDAREFLAKASSAEVLKAEMDELKAAAAKQEELIEKLLAERTTEPKKAVKKASTKKAVTKK